MSVMVRNSEGVYGVNLGAKWARLCTITLSSYRRVARELERYSGIMTDEQKNIIASVPSRSSSEAHDALQALKALVLWKMRSWRCFRTLLFKLSESRYFSH